MWKEWQPSLPVKENGSYVVGNVDSYSMADILPVSLYSNIFVWSFFTHVINAHHYFTQFAFQVCYFAKNLAMNVFSMLVVVETLPS